jgi:tetratricopeptide (TPR) repeat protein
MNLPLKLRIYRIEVLLIVTLAIVFCVYIRSLGNGFVYDDHAEIVTNRYISEWSFVWKSALHDSWWFRRPSALPQSAYYRPAQNVLLALGFHLAGRNPVGWHLLKIALHLLAVTLVFRLGTLLTDDAWVGLLAAALFGLHPVHVESVVWAAALPEPLVSVFIFGAFCCFARRSKISYGRIWAVLLFAGAALSHEAAIAFPVLFSLHAILYESDAGGVSVDGKSDSDGAINWSWVRVRGALWESAPFYAVSCLYLLARASALGFAHLFGNAHIKATSRLISRQIVQVKTVVNHSTLQLLATVPLVMLDYLKLLFFPWQAGPAHPVKVVQHLGFGEFYGPLTAILLIVAAAWMLIRRSSRTRIYLFCAAWFIIGLAPSMNFDQVVAPVQDRYLYLPSFGWCVIAADWVTRFARRDARRRRISEIALVALFVMLIGIDWRLESVWRDDLALFGRCVADSPDSTTYRVLLSRALEQNGDLPRAAEQLSKAVQLEPDSAALHHALGALDLRMGRKAEAQKEFDRSMAIFAPWALGKDLPGPTAPARE